MLVRRGECNRCGLCCVDPDRDTERATGLSQVTPGYCVYFRWTTDGSGKRIGECVGRESAYYRQGCDVYPQQPRDIAECSYEWVEVTDGNR